MYFVKCDLKRLHVGGILLSIGYTLTCSQQGHANNKNRAIGSLLKYIKLFARTEGKIGFIMFDFNFIHPSLSFHKLPPGVMKTSFKGRLFSKPTDCFINLK